MLVQHPLTECAILLPLVPPILGTNAALTRVSSYIYNTYNKSLVSDGCREVSIKREEVIVTIVSLVCNYVLEESSLMAQNFR